MMFPFGMAGSVHDRSTDVDVMLVMFGAVRPRGSSEAVVTVTGGLPVHPATVHTPTFTEYVVIGSSDVISDRLDAVLKTSSHTES